MSCSERTLEAIRFDPKTNTLEILDQLVLPYLTNYIKIATIEDAYQAIRQMKVRGAPAIAIVGAFALTVDLSNKVNADDGAVTVESLITCIDYLISSRPTAVNLSNALNEIKSLVLEQADLKDIVDNSILDLVSNYSISLHKNDLANNFRIGENGLNYIVECLQKESFKGPFSIMTICNTGSLATSGHGTALGVIRTVFQKLNKQQESKYGFWLDHVFPCETRPYNQGAKLTTYELKYERIPFTMICDNMVASLINTLNVRQAPVKDVVAPVKFIIVGADRIVLNGDAANKIGTFQLATIADSFNRLAGSTPIKFMVAAPNTTIDLKTRAGTDIVIEERPSAELTTLVGPILDEAGQPGPKATVGIATPGIKVWNPAFDVTPYRLIDSIVTEDKAIVRNDNGEFNLSKS